MRRTSVVTHASHRFRVGPWRGVKAVAYVAPLIGDRPVSPEAVEACLAQLERHGYRSAVTSALDSREAAGFEAAGFEVAQRLHLLQRDLTGVSSTVASFEVTDSDHEYPARSGRPEVRSRRVYSTVRRATRRDRPRILELDGLSFDAFWRFDAHGLREALTATPLSRLRIAGDGRVSGNLSVVGYAICGKADDRGYLQRLAVHPDHRGRGVGLSLVDDTLRWLVRRGAISAVVNTQEHNTAALALYERVGFRRQSPGLVVLTRDLAPQSAPV